MIEWLNDFKKSLKLTQTQKQVSGSCLLIEKLNVYTWPASPYHAEAYTKVKYYICIKKWFLFYLKKLKIGPNYIAIVDIYKSSNDAVLGIL